MSENTDIRHELQRAGLTEIGLEALTIHPHLYAIIRLHLSAPCPDDWVTSEFITGYGHTAADAEAEAAKLAQVKGAFTAVDIEKIFKCGRFNCPVLEQSKCMFDWGLIGKPSAAVELPEVTTKKHGIKVKKQWESSQEVGYGCFCIWDA
jgi:hypothetical protein